MKTDRNKPALVALLGYLVESAQSCRANRWLRPWFKFTVAEELAKDVAAEQAVAARNAYFAEQCDCEAERELRDACAELEAAMSDGLDGSDIKSVIAAIQRVKRARRNVQRSAALDRNIHESFPATSTASAVT
jgi:hypothetical protein